MEELKDDFDFGPPPVTREMHRVAIGLARAFLAGDHSPAGLRERGTRALGRPWPWLTRVSLRIHFDFGAGWHGSAHDKLVAAILSDPQFLDAFLSENEAPRIRTHFAWHPSMEPPPRALAASRVPALASAGELADWLGVSPTQLDWFAGILRESDGRRPERLRHYRYRWLPKATGGMRLIEAPKLQLRDLQRLILRGILDRIPPHPAAHGCVRGKSVVGNAALHVGAPLLLKLDLRDFFPSIPARRIFALFRTLGYPTAPALYLARLTTHRTPPDIRRLAPLSDAFSPEERLRQLSWIRQHAEAHLPQGAPTSPALANLCSYRLDSRLEGAAEECGARYTRFVDDLAISCATADRAKGRRILTMADQIIREEGFLPNWRKARVESASVPQRVTGITVNRRTNLPREDYDTLRAILTNCRRHGPETQNRTGVANFREHLLGRIAWFAQVNAERGRKLRAMYDLIVWDR
jgi:hypothetical protein